MPGWLKAWLAFDFVFAFVWVPAIYDARARGELSRVDKIIWIAALLLLRTPIGVLYHLFVVPKCDIWKLRNLRRRIRNITLLHEALIPLAIVFLAPFAWMVSTSFKPDEQILTYPPQWIPKPLLEWDWGNVKGSLANLFRYYREALQFIAFILYLRNTIYLTILSMVGAIISSSLVAYAFARLRWPGRDLLFYLMLSTMMLPPQVTMVPVFLVFRKLGWVDTFKPLWVPAWFGVPFYIFLLRQFMLTLPTELEEAARIDGCGFFTIWWRIVLPLLKPALAVVAIFQFMAAWNDFMGPLIYLSRMELFNLSYGIYIFQSQHGGYINLTMAAATMMVIPVIALFFAAQRYFVAGIALTGMKG